MTICSWATTMALLERMETPESARQKRGQPPEARATCYGHGVVRQHRRFELLNVMLDGQAVGNATIDSWEDDASVPRWAARILMKVAHESTAGTLTGSTREGKRMKGRVTIGIGSVGPKGGSVIVDLHGDGPLEEDTDTVSPDA